MPPGTPSAAKVLSGAAIIAATAQPNKSPYFIVTLSLVVEGRSQGIQTGPQRGLIGEFAN
jgi:hypothetical protein